MKIHRIYKIIYFIEFDKMESLSWRSSWTCGNGKITIQSDHCWELRLLARGRSKRHLDWVPTLHALPWTLSFRPRVISLAALPSWSPHWSPLECGTVVLENWQRCLVLSKPWLDSRLKIEPKLREASLSPFLDTLFLWTGLRWHAQGLTQDRFFSFMVLLCVSQNTLKLRQCSS